MSSRIATKHEQTVDRHTGQAQKLKRTDEQEVEAKASANAGLNLNIGAAVSGIFSGSKKKQTDTESDGSSHSTEYTQGRGQVAGSGVGNLSAEGGGEASVTEKQRRTVEGSQQQIDHLGLGDSTVVASKE